MGGVGSDMRFLARDSGGGFLFRCYYDGQESSRRSEELESVFLNQLTAILSRA